MIEKEETLTSQVMPFFLGLITNSTLILITELGLTWLVLITIGIGIVYSVLHVSRKKSKKSRKYEQKKLKPEKVSDRTVPEGTQSRRVTKVLIRGFIIAIILVGVASLILRPTFGVILQLMGWLVIMITFVLSGNFLSGAKMVIFLRGIAVVSLGGALSIGGIPTYEYITAEPVQLTICNYCSSPIVYDPLDINVPGNTKSKPIDLLPLTVTFKRERDYVFVHILWHTVEYDVPEDAFVKINGDIIKPGESLRVDLSEQKEHELLIECKSNSTISFRI